MKILAPLSAVENYEVLAEAGADEFFCGFIPYSWLKKYSNLSAMNRREYMYSSNICSFDEMKTLRKKVDKYNFSVKITLNALYYVKDQYELLIPTIKKLIDIGFDTFIIADIALIKYLRNHKINCNIHLSGETAEVNSLSIKFFNEFNIQRYVFHRKNSLADMESCIENNVKSNIEYEAFILNELCTYTGGFCNTIHCEEMDNACSIPFKMSRIDSESDRFAVLDRTFRLFDRMGKAYENNSLNTQSSFGGTGCGVCELKEMKRIGITSLKVVGRGKKLDLLKNDIVTLRKILGLIDQTSDVTHFRKMVKEDILSNKCSNNCYYL